MTARDLAIDLGTGSIRVWGRGRGVILSQPSVTAVNVRSGAVLAMGDEAYTLADRSSGHIVVERPLRGGAVIDFGTTARMLEMVLKRCGATRRQRPKVLLCVPSTITHVERRAVEEAAHRAGAAHAYLMEQPMAAAIGAGLPVQEPVGSMIVDIGAGATEVAVLSLGGLVTSKAVKVGGFDIDTAIQNHIRDEYGLAIGERTAEDLKKAIGAAYPQQEEPKAEIRGRELSSGLPKSIVIAAEEVREAIDEQVTAILRAVLDTLSDCPPELVQDVLSNGIALVGGGALLQGLDARIAHESQVKVVIGPSPLEAVILGAGHTLEAFDNLKHLIG